MTEEGFPGASKRMNVALLCNVRPVELPAVVPDDLFEEYDSGETIAHVTRALSALGVCVEPVIADRRLPWRLEEGGYEFVFNIAEGQGRRCREAIPAAVCEMMGLPFTGSDVLTLTLTLDKALARRVVSPDVPVARAVLADGVPWEHELERLRYPVLVKPNDEGSSKGIRQNALADSESDAAEKCRWLKANYRCPVLIEEFLTGAEVTVGVAGNGAGAHVIGMMEIAPAEENGAFIYSLEAKRDWRRCVRYHIPPRLSGRMLEDLEQHALTAYRLLGCRDLARLDFRLCARGVPHFLECNPLPGLHPESGDIVILSRSQLSFEALVQGVFIDAAGRAGVALPWRS